MECTWDIIVKESCILSSCYDAGELDATTIRIHTIDSYLLSVTMLNSMQMLNSEDYG
jgi:hypothetical protein